MRETLSWLNDALASKDIGAGMTHYKVANGNISSTDGRITASHPWPFGKDEFLVAGAEFEKVLKRMKGTPTLTKVENGIKLKDGRFSGTIKTLPLTEWEYPGVAEAKWQALPAELPGLLKALRPFVAENASQAWASCVAIDDGWLFATNNVAIAGAPCEGLNSIKALLPPWTVDFILARTEGLSEWAWTDNFIAFKWENGAWMRSQLIVGEFPERAAGLVKASVNETPSQKVTDEFRTAFTRIAELADDTVSIYADRITSTFGKAIVEDGIECEIPLGAECSVFGARFLLPVMKEAEAWSPSSWPKPSVFRGKKISGYCVGRKV